MSVVWSCNEWDQLEEVIVGNPLHARFPTADRSTQMAEFSDRSLAEIPRGPAFAAVYTHPTPLGS
jgi:hypothetical protein